MKKRNYFLNEKKEFIIENMYPRRPLLNYLWNETCFSELNQFCCGNTIACVDGHFRDVVKENRLIYIKDRDNGKLFDINRNIKNLPYKMHKCHVGLGYQTVESLYDGVQSSFTIIIPEVGNCEMHRITVKNVSDSVRRLSVYPYVSPAIYMEGHLAYGKAYYDEGIGGLYYSFHAFGEKDHYRQAFFRCSEKFVGYNTSSADFIGVYNSTSDPLALKNENIGEKKATFVNDYCAAVQFDFELQPQEEKEIYCVVGTAASYEESKNTAVAYSTKEAFDKEYRKQEELNAACLDRMQIKTPDEYINTTVNIWLKRQISLGKNWGRIYSKGFRDLLQDITGFVSLDGETARKKLLGTIKYQYISGNAVRSFDPIMTHPYQDMPVWIPMAFLAYLKEYNDFSILEEQVGYYGADDVESVFTHIKRGMDYLYSHQGKHGLNLWGGGDWNDSINNCGMQMIGESVWLAIATVKATNDYVEILSKYKKQDVSEIIKDVQEKKARLIENIIKYGYEKDHFIYGYNDWGEKLGSYECKEGKMYLNPQTWAVMAGIFNDEQSGALLDGVEKNLKCDYGYMQNVPEYTTPDDHIGRVSYFGPGLYENGSVYNHGVIFKVVADCLLKRGDLAYQTLKLIRYDNPKNPDSGTEPYAISNMYLGPNAFANKGYAPYSWITGSAPWLYRAITEFILGIKPDFDGLVIDPSLPSDWDKFEAVRIYQQVKYVIKYKRNKRSDKSYIKVDGVKIKGNKVSGFEAGSTHTVEVIF